MWLTDDIFDLGVVPNEPNEMADLYLWLGRYYDLPESASSVMFVMGKCFAIAVV